MNVLDDSLLTNLYACGWNDYQVAKELRVGRNRLRLWREVHSIASKSKKKI